MGSAAAILSARGIVKRFGGVTALHDGRLDIRQGEITGLLGANGSGKTTLLKILSGIHRPDGGEIKVGGFPIRIESPVMARGMGIGMVHQHLSLVEEMPIWQNIVLGAERRGALGFCRSERATAARFCSDFGLRLEMEDPVKALSPGDRQLVEILKALFRKPRILLLDEPTASLELAEVNKLFAILRKFVSEGVSMVFTSHRMWEVMDICDSATVFRNGEFVEDIDLRAGNHTNDYVVSLIAGKELTARPRENRDIPRDGALARVQGLRLPRFKYGDGQSLDFTIRRGEVIGLSGLQGQGQEDLLWALSGMHRSVVPVMEWEGQAKRIRHPRDAVRQGVFLIPGDRNREGLFDQHGISFNIAYPRLAMTRKGTFVRDRQLRKEALEVMRRLSVKAESETTPIRNLSGGNQQKVVLGKWLNRGPRILLLSDPAKGIDVEAKRQLYEVIGELAAAGVSVILYASDNQELVDICDRIYVMFEGKFIEEFDGASVCGEDLTAHSLSGKVARRGEAESDGACDEEN